MLFGPGPQGLVPGTIILGFWAFVFYSDSRPRTFGIAIALAILGLCVWGALIPPTASGPARKVACKNNLKQIGIALHNYHEEHGSFPPAFIADETGKLMHSWRVLLLRYLDQPDLYEAYDFSKPWDSPENLELLKRMPPLFACPSRQESTTTSYVAVVGPGTVWPGFESTKLSDMNDGTANIIMVIEHHSNISWTEPRDFSLEEAATALSSTDIESVPNHRNVTFFSEMFHGPSLLLGDGRVFSASLGLDQTVATELMTIDDGKPAGGSDLANAGIASVTRTKWGNVIRFWTCVLLTVLPLPWVWIHPQGVKTQAATDKPEVPPPALP